MNSLSVSRGGHAEAASRHGGQKRALKWSAAAFSGRKMAGEPVGPPGTIRSASFVFCPEGVPVLKALLAGKLAIGHTDGQAVVHDVRHVEQHAVDRERGGAGKEVEVTVEARGGRTD